MSAVLRREQALPWGSSILPVAWLSDTCFLSSPQQHKSPRGIA